MKTSEQPSAPNRKDNQGRNTILRLEYYRDFFAYLLKSGYESLNINQRIAVRTAYCGVEYPSVCIKSLITDEL